MYYLYGLSNCFDIVAQLFKLVKDLLFKMNRVVVAIVIVVLGILAHILSWALSSILENFTVQSTEKAITTIKESAKNANVDKYWLDLIDNAKKTFQISVHIISITGLILLLLTLISPLIKLVYY